MQKSEILIEVFMKLFALISIHYFVFQAFANLHIMFRLFLADPDEARGCSINSLVVN